MRDGQGNKLSPEEQQKVRSIQGAPDQDSLSGVSIDPNAGKDTGDADKSPPPVKPGEKPAAGPGE
ncbi:hypothetical protein [Bosea sp. UC22_33]|uniref:hypothetical protein n=1 Tax=Bosea sp. UC22_33 TaxID=3350165 RepID=UPI00367015DF